MEAKNTSTFVFITFFIMLGGCTSTPSPTIPKSSEPTPPCVYESIKGVAEVISISNKEVTYKFYPGDLVFSLPASSLNNTDISPTQELKAIIRTPLSGPCEKTEFELLSTVE